MSKKTDSDFASLIGQVKSIKKPDVAPTFGRKPPRRIKRRMRERERVQYREQAQLSHNFDRIGSLLFHQMCQGRAHCSECIDLHGMYVSDGINYLRDMIEMRRNRHLTCWHIIHGKGSRSPHYDRAPLKHAVIELLLNHPAVAAIATQHDSDGTSGAVIIAIQPQVS